MNCLVHAVYVSLALEIIQSNEDGDDPLRLWAIELLADTTPTELPASLLSLTEDGEVQFPITPRALSSTDGVSITTTDSKGKNSHRNRSMISASTTELWNLILDPYVCLANGCLQRKTEQPPEQYAGRLFAAFSS